MAFDDRLYACSCDNICSTIAFSIALNIPDKEVRAEF